MADRIVVNASPLIVLSRARRIPLARPLVEELVRAGLYLSEPVIERALRLVGE